MHPNDPILPIDAVDAASLSASPSPSRVQAGMRAVQCAAVAALLLWGLGAWHNGQVAQRKRVRREAREAAAAAEEFLRSGGAVVPATVPGAATSSGGSPADPAATTGG